MAFQNEIVEVAASISACAPNVTTKSSSNAESQALDFDLLLQEATLFYQIRTDILQGIISLSKDFSSSKPRCNNGVTPMTIPQFKDFKDFSSSKPRCNNGVTPMTIPHFKDWASQTGVNMLPVASVTLWKSRKAPWFHEFIVVTLEPHQTFKPRAIAAPISPLALFDLEKNIKEGLRFRVDRGRMAKQSKLPSLRSSSGSQPAAADMVELINLGIKLDEYNLCNIFELSKDFRVGGADFFDFFAIRVHNILFCVEKVSHMLGGKYKLWSSNCWTFASWIMKLVRDLFTGKGRNNFREDLNNPIRRQFFRGIEMTRTFFRGNLRGNPEGNHISLIQSPFRHALLWTSRLYTLVDPGSSRGYLCSIMQGLLMLELTNACLRAPILSVVISFLAPIVNKHTLIVLATWMSDTPYLVAYQAVRLTCMFMIEKKGFWVTESDLKQCFCFYLCHDSHDKEYCLITQAILGIALNRKDLIRAMLDAGALDIIIRALMSPYLTTGQGWALLAIANISNEEQILRSKQGLGPVIKTFVRRFMPKSPNFLLCFLSQVVKSHSLSRLFVEWGLAEDLAKYLTRKTVEHDKTCSPAFHALWAWIFETESKKGTKYLYNAGKNGYKATSVVMCDPETLDEKQIEASNKHFKKLRQQSSAVLLRNVSYATLCAVFFNVYGLKARDRRNKQSENVQVSPHAQGIQDHTDREGREGEPLSNRAPTEPGAAAQGNTVLKPKIVKFTCSEFQRFLNWYRDYLEKRDDSPL